MGKKDEQLNMPHSTAQNKLRKLLLFKYLSLAGENACHRCEELMTVDNFSVEHKQSWLDVSPDLFWDLDNIAFAHLRCNIQAARLGSITPIEVRAKLSASWTPERRAAQAEWVRANNIRKGGVTGIAAGR